MDTRTFLQQRQHLLQAGNRNPSQYTKSQASSSLLG